MPVLDSDSEALELGDRGEGPLEGMTHIQRQLQEILSRIDALSQQISNLEARESELRVVLERDSEFEPHLERLEKVLRKRATPERVSAVIDGATLHLEPCPYAVIDNLLPPAVYESLVRGLPPVALFPNKAGGKHQLAVPFPLAPAYSQRIWTYLANDLIPNTIAPRIIVKFREPLDQWLLQNWPDVDPASVDLHGSGGRVMFRRRGYVIRPHRDPKWSFITCILYVARPGDDESWGTQLYAVDEDEEAKNAAPFWIDERRCRLVEDVKFKPNRLLVFLNSTGAHGAHIPEDAQPPDLERYIYQFRVGPSMETIAMLKSKLPDERQALWTGKSLVDY